jgi:16S rRNA (guanine527-N7)-methyltransferase
VKFNPQIALSILKAGLPRTSGAAREQLARYCDLVTQYDSTARLTGYDTTEQLVEELVVEGARLLELGAFANAMRVADLGSGNGSPVVPLAVLCPRARFTAIESNQRKAAFLGLVANSLGLANLTVVTATVQLHLRSLAQPYDCATSRAFAPPAKLFPLARKLLRPGGEVRGFFGAEIATVEQAAQACGFEMAQVLTYQTGEMQRHVYRAVAG